MMAGEIIARGHDLFIVLAADATRAAVAPLLLARRSRFTHAVPVRAGALGEGFVLCAKARLDADPGQFTGYCLCLRDLEACQLAARRAQEDAELSRRYAPLSAFEQAMPRKTRNGGRRVGPRQAAA